MQSFFITCTTCQQRLKVADTAAVGEIQICPKCGSMVLVEAPPDAKSPESDHDAAPAAPSTADQTTTDSKLAPASEAEPPVQTAIDQGAVDVAVSAKQSVPNDVLDQAGPPPVDEQPQHGTADDGDVADGDHEEWDRSDENRASEVSDRGKHLDPVAAAMPETKDLSDDVAAPSSEDETIDSDATAEPPFPPGTEVDSNAGRDTSEAPDDDEDVAEQASPDGHAVPLAPPAPQSAFATESFRQWAMVGIAALSGIILAFAVIGYLATRTADQQADNPRRIADSPQPNSSPNEPPPMSVTPDDENPAAQPNTPPAEPPSEPPTETPAEPATEPATEPAAKTDTADVTDPPEPPVKPDIPSKPETPPPAESVNPKNESVVSDGNENPDDMPLIPREDANAGASPTNDAAALSETLNAFAPFIDTTPFPDRTAKIEDQGIDSSDLPTEKIDSDSGSLPRPEPREIDLPARLADRLPQIDFREIPLVDFVQFISDFSTIPISMDCDALALVKVAPTKPITVQFKDSTVAEILKETLPRLRLDYVAGDQHLLVTRPRRKDGDLREHEIDLSGLPGANASDISILADWIVDLVEPNSWEAAGGRGKIAVAGSTLLVTQDDVPLFRTLLFCEKLRVARGLSPKTSFAPKLYQGPPRFSRADDRLTRPLTMNYVEPVRLTRILKHIRSETGVTCLVDWRALMDIGWTLETEAQVSTNNEPLKAALKRLLGPMELTLRVIDETTVEITTPDGLADNPDVEFFEVDDLISQDLPAGQLVDAARLELGVGVFQSGGGSGLLYVEPASSNLIAALPQPQQRKLAAWLASLRE